MGEQRMWKCDVCGYIHKGDAPPKTCPVCGVGEENFSRVEVVEARPSRASTGAWRCTICDHIHQGESPPDVCPVCSAPKELFEPLAPEELRSQDAGIRRVVVVGAGIAGLTAAEEARRVGGEELEITLLSSEPGLPYYRLNLTRYLADEVGKDSLEMQTAGWFDQQQIRLVTGVAAGLDRQAKIVSLKAGGALPYDRLVLAMGAHSFVPPVSGADLAGVFVLRTRGDADGIIARAADGARAVCIGGGLLGLETAGALVKRGLAVTVLERAGWVLRRQLPETAGGLLTRHLEARGISVVSHAEVAAINADEDGSVKSVSLKDGRELAADLVVMSAGVRPNSYLARLSEIDVGSGVLVDDGMVTSDRSILAAGDVAEHRGVIYSIWPTAYMQGLVAGRNAVGGDARFSGAAPYNRLKVIDVDLFSIGRTSLPDGSFELYEEVDGDNYRALVCRDGRLVGGVLYGDTRLSGPLKDAVESGKQVYELAELMAALPGWRCSLA